MMFHSDAYLVHYALDRAERLHAEALDRARAAEGAAARSVPLRTALAGGLARLARLLGAVAEDLDPQVARPSW